MSRDGATSTTDAVRDRAEHVLSRIRPALQDDGGDVELVEVTGAGVAKIRLLGACLTCPSSHITLQEGIERNLVDKVPEIVSVEQVID